MSDLSETELQRLSDETVARYQERYEEFGISPKTLGWGSNEHQRIRFQAVRDLIDLNGRSILDWGCGFGDLLGDLISNEVRFKSYTGADINPAFIDEARRLHGSRASVSFEVSDAAQPLPKPNSADVVILLGLANFEQADIDTEAYARLLLRAGFEAARQAVVCDFLSSIPTADYERESAVHYYEPATVLAWALELSPLVVLKHDYLPIPQREMMLKVSRP